MKIETTNFREGEQRCKSDPVAPSILNKKITSKNCGEFIVLEKDTKNNYYIVEFLDTKTKSSFRKDAILSGEIRNPFKPIIYNIAYTGNIVTKKHQELYNRWKKMLERCYDERCRSYKSYGGNGVTICKEWLCFETFVNDVIKLENYSIENLSLLHLDKDKKIPGNKVYSKETCQWLLAKENNEYQPSQQKEFTATSPEGKTYVDYNITRFAKEHKLDRRGISQVLHKRSSNHFGWKFEFKIKR